MLMSVRAQRDGAAAGVFRHHRRPAGDCQHAAGAAARAVGVDSPPPSAIVPVPVVICANRATVRLAAAVTSRLVFAVSMSASVKLPSPPRYTPAPGEVVVPTDTAVGVFVAWNSSGAHWRRYRRPCRA